MRTFWRDTQDMLDRAIAVRDHVLAEPDLNELLNRPHTVEHSLFWSEEIAGGWDFEKHEPLVVPFRFKARYDWLGEPANGEPWTILDVKKMQVGAGSRRERSNLVYKYGWHRQAYHYIRALRLWKELSEDVPVVFAWLFVEDNEPYDVVMHYASAETLDIGRCEMRHGISQWAEAVVKDRFLGMQNRAEQDIELYLPQFARDEYHRGDN